MCLDLIDFIMPWFVHFLTGEQVLDNISDRFINEMDTMSVVHSLYDERIISNGVFQQVITDSDWRRQNAILFAHLKRAYTKDSLMTTCHKIIAVPGNPRMKALGEDILSMLEGECGTHVSLNGCLHDRAYICFHVTQSCRTFIHHIRFSW